MQLTTIIFILTYKQIERWDVIIVKLWVSSQQTLLRNPCLASISLTINFNSHR